MVEEIPQSHYKLAATATGGIGGEHSPYARRAVSAGYKGLIQGTISGAALYGLFGTAIGTILGAGMFVLSGFNPLAFLAIPAIGGLGVWKGAETFGLIGAVASINAETQEMNERRDALLERLKLTTSQKEADEITRLLAEDSKPKKPEKIFHMKTMLIGMALGIAAAVGITALSAAVPGLGIHIYIGELAEFLLGSMNIAHGAATLLTAGTVGAAIGGLAGATIGVDREVVRGMFDFTENALHDDSKSKDATLARQREATKLSELARSDDRKDMRIDVQSGKRTHQESDREHSTPRVKIEKTESPHTERLMTAEEAIRIQL